MNVEKPRRVSHTYVQRLAAPPAAVFPLLCPVREAEWLEDWDPRRVLSSTGVAEPDCVFVTAAEPQDAVWFITRHEPARHFVEMLKITPDVTAAKISIALAPAPGGCEATVTYAHTSLGPAGDAFLETFTEEFYGEFLRAWEDRLNHFLRTGKPLHARAAKPAAGGSPGAAASPSATGERQNALGQPIGPDVPGWKVPPRPPRRPMEGRWCRLEPLDPEAHAAALHEAYREDREGRCWTYLAYGPFDSLEDYRAWMEANALGDDPLFFAIRERATGRPGGVASYLRIDPPSGSLEVGHLCYAPVLQRTRAATEAMYLMMKQAFDLGYRRYEWKCDALNAPSRRAALRLGFRFEGIFRQATLYKGRNRDTAWYAVLDREWPEVRRRYERWLEPGNFRADGSQIRPLA